MRKITLTLFALVVFITAYCGTPQAISYQAVVQRSSGTPISNRDISLRLSILAGSATGPVSYEETQSAGTDGIGVVAVNIGSGTAVSGSFSGINWSAGTYFLKTEIDTNGGTNYATVGTVQFFSVPYSLYSAKAAQSNTASLQFPDGTDSLTPVILNGTFSYQVPVGQTLYITDLTQNASTTCTGYGIAINGVTLSPSESSTGGSTSAEAVDKVNFPMTVPSGYVLSSTTCATSLVGFVVPANNTCVVFDLSVGNYTVPVGKVLVIQNLMSATTWNYQYSIGGNVTSFTKRLNFADQGTTISASGLTGSLMMMGYLKNR